MNTMLPKFIVGIGGSAGGIVAYKAFLNALSSRTGAAFVIVSHILPAATSELADILSRHTKMPVSVASTTMHIQADNVYVCSPNADLLIEDDVFNVVVPRAKQNEIRR